MKIALYLSKKEAGSKGVAAKMAESMRLCPGQKTEAWGFDGGEVSIVTSSDQFSAIQMLQKIENGNFLLISGVPLDLHGNLNQRLLRILKSDAGQASKALSELDGIFCGVFWNENEKKLVVVSDPLGFQTLYISHTEKGILMASEMKAFPASGLIELEMDPAGWGAFIAMGMTVEDRTQLKGVRRFPPATIMVWDAATRSVKNQIYWQWPKSDDTLTMDQVDTSAIIQTMTKELDAYAQHNKSGSVLLSGGFDSRLTLAIMAQRDWNPKALIFAHQDEYWGADSKLALMAAKELGIDYDFIKTPRGYYNQPSYLDYMIMNEVSTPSLYLFISQVLKYITSEREVIWDGTPPGYGLVPAFLPPGGFDVFFRSSVRSRESFAWKTADSTFGRARSDEMYDSFKASFHREIEKYPNNEMGVTMFEVYNRMRNRTSPNAVKVYSNKALSCMLGVSRDFWTMAGHIPYSVTRDYQLYFKVFRNHFPGLARIPFLSGTSLWCDETSGWRGEIAKLYYKIARNRVISLSKKAYYRYFFKSKKYWADSKYLELTWKRLCKGHPDLDMDGISKLDQTTRLPFYWQMWRWILSGELTTWNSQNFFD